MWGYSADTRFVKDATLTFDLATLGERLATEFDADAIATPRLRFSDDRIWTLVKLLADAVNDPDPSAQLYGDGLTAAIVARLFARAASVRGGQRQGPGLLGSFGVSSSIWTPICPSASISRIWPQLAGLSQIALQPGVQGLDRNGALSLAARCAHPTRPGSAARHPRLARPGGRRHRLCRRRAFRPHVPEIHRRNPGSMAKRSERVIVDSDWRSQNRTVTFKN